MFLQSYYGIDIGARSAKVVKVTLTGAGPILERALHVQFGGSEPGTELWKDQAASAIRNAIADAGLKISRAVVGVSGRDAIMRYAHVPPVQPWRLKLIMKYQVEEMAGKQGQDVASDYRLLSIQRSHLDEFVVLVAMARSDAVASRVEILKNAGIMPAAACPTPVGVYNTYAAFGSPDADKTVLLLDIGRDSTDAAIVQAGDLIFARGVSLGGDAFTKAVAAEMKMGDELAERAKIEEGVLKIDGHVTKREETISNALMAVGAQFSNMISSTLDFARQQTRLKDLLIDKIVLTGGGSRVKGLPEYLRTTLGMDVEYFDLSASAKNTLPAQDSAQFSSKMLELSCAVGLALAPSGKDSILMDLLPPAFRKEREFKESTRYLYIGGVLALIFLAVMFTLTYASSSGAAKAKESLDAAEKELAVRESANEDVKADNAKIKRTVESMSAETFGGYFYTHFLFILRKAMPPRMTVTEVSMFWEEVPRAEGGRAGRKRMAVKLAGQILTPSGDEKAQLEAFLKRLKSDPEILKYREDKYDPTPTRGVDFSYTFLPAKEITRAGDLGRQ
jgi:type IV pilus assembly protein PilM